MLGSALRMEPAGILHRLLRAEGLIIQTEAERLEKTEQKLEAEGLEDLGQMPTTSGDSQYNPCLDSQDLVRGCEEQGMELGGSSITAV